MKYNEDELVAPEWVNATFLKEVLEHNGELKNVTVEDFKTSPATALGDHFASIMFRINITFSTDSTESQSRSVILKTLPFVEGLKKDMLTHKDDDIDIFGTEMFMYSKVLEDCAKIVQSAGYTDKFAPKMLYHSNEPDKVIVFEDLKELGYFMFPKTLPKEDEANLIFKKLGQYHAAVYKLKAEGRDDLKLRGCFFNMPGIEQIPFFRAGITYLSDVVKTLPGFEEAAEKFSRINYDKLIKMCRETVNTPGSYNVLNHGDYHIKNMMFNGKEKDEISEVILLDFQICHYASPAFDLCYMSSVMPYEMRDRLIRVYFNTFIDVLKKSGFNGTLPTYEDLEKDLKSYRHLDLYFLATFACFMSIEDDMEIQLEDFMKDVTMLEKFYYTPKYIEFVKNLLPVLLKDGTLDRIVNYE